MNQVSKRIRPLFLFSALSLGVVGLAGCPDEVKEEIKAEQHRIGGAPKRTLDDVKKKMNAASALTDERLKAVDEAED
ncbi:MAG: hypothetical protein GY822_11000 [Deltaproteobacteria bacterium]|nr:hypothetical protein [Deltaproteobacteria bacterium]